MLMNKVCLGTAVAEGDGKHDGDDDFFRNNGGQGG